MASSENHNNDDSTAAGGGGGDTSTFDLEQEITNEFHQLASSAVDLSNAHVSESGILTIQRSVRDWDKDQRKSLLYQFSIPNPSLSSEQVLEQQQQQLPPIPMDPSVQLRLPSPSGKKLLVVKKVDGDKLELELWEKGALLRRIPITTKEQHGSIVHDPTGFGIASWSPDESSIVYIAERLAPKTRAFWEHKGGSSNSASIAGGKHVLGEGHQEEWGEQYVGQAPLLDLYILHVHTAKLERIANVPGANHAMDGGVTLGQPVWHPTLPQIAYTGWDAGGLDQMPKRLGMVYCRNRPSSIYVSDVGKMLQRLADPQMKEEGEGEEEGTSEEDSLGFNCLTSSFPYARSPQYLETGEMIFLANPNEFVSHDGCMGLFRTMTTTSADQNNDIDCVIPVVDIPSDDGPKVCGMGFPGLFLNQLPPKACCVGDGGSKYLILSTVWGSLSKLVRVNIETRQVQLLDFADENSSSSSTSASTSLQSHSLQCQTPSGDWIVSTTATNSPPSLWLLPKEDVNVELNDQPTLFLKNARLLTKFAPIAASSFSPIQADQSAPFDVQIVRVPSDDESLPPMQAILTLPTNRKEGEKVGLVVIPHGGPHSATISSYVPGFALLASCYAVVFPNYRGSTGFGQASLKSLLTNIGRNDVDDVMSITRHVLAKWKESIDETKVGICGGSHGGFLTSHCIGQYPDFFKAAVMRNPVTNIASMVTATDIPDWCHAEALGRYDFSKFRGPTAEELQTMYKRSPIVHVSKVRTPTLMALGMKDLRVPPSQGMEMFHALKSLGVDTKLLVYPEDNHALNRVATEADHWIQIRKWFNKYLV